MQFAEQVGLNIRVLRVRKQLSQEELAARMDVERQQVSDFELGKRNLTLKTIERLCVALECEPALLFEGIKFPSRKKR